MIQYERIDISEGVDFDNTNKSVECMICHYLYFKDIGFNYEPYDFVILTVKNVDCRSCLVGINKKDAISLLNNPVLGNKGVL